MAQAPGHLIAPDGSALFKPATRLDAAQAATIRAYFLWAMQHQLEPELLCATCFEYTRASKATFTIDETQIVIVCQCAQRYFKGRTPPSPVLQPAVGGMDDHEGIAQVFLSEDMAKLLRAYKAVITALGLKEALRCNVCWEDGRPDGCHANVVSRKIGITCRCTNRIYLGMTN